MSITATELKMNLSKYLMLAEKEDIYITRNGEGDTVLMDLNAFTRREEELDRREAVLEHRAMILEAEMGRLAGKATYTPDQVRAKIQQHLGERQRQKNG